MKWIGQHIYDFVSRFKSDVYIEEDDRSFHFDISAAALAINSGAGNGPYLQLKNEDSDSNPAYLQFFKYGDNGTAGDDIGVINFNSKLDNGNTLNYAQVLGEISDPSNAGAEGKISIFAKAHNTPYGNVITGEGNGDGVVDVTLALGASSTTTIAGDLSVTTGLILDSVDITTIQTSAESFADNDTSLMTSAAIDDRIVAATSSTFVDLTSEVSGVLPVANGGTGASSLTDNKLLTGTGTSAVTAEANATYDGADLTLTSATSTKPILSIENTTNDANAGELKLIGRRSSDASVVAGAGDDAGTISFIGENAKSGPDPETIPYGKIASESYAVTDGAEMGKMTMSVGVNQSAIGGSLGFMDFLSSYASVFGEATTFGSGGLMSTNTFDATITNFTSTVTTGPIFGVYNYTDDATGPQFTIGNLRGGIGGSKTDGSDNDSCGVINFAAYDDGTPTQTTFAKIEGIAKDVSDGAEEGKLTLSVASHDAEIQPGLTIESGDAEDEVDVTIGNGSASVVTVPGFISIGGHTINDIDVAGEFVDSDEHLMTAAAINDRIAAAGGGGGGSSKIHITWQDPQSYLFYLFNNNSWYSTGSSTLALLGTGSSPSDISSSNSEYGARIAIYTAIAACTVNKLTFNWYWSSSAISGTKAFEFAFSKFTPQDGSLGTITMNSITATDNNGNYTEFTPYQETFTFSGGNATLAAGDSIAMHMRTTDGSSSQRVLVYGTITLEAELS